MNDRPRQQDFTHGSGQVLDAAAFNAAMTVWLLGRIADALERISAPSEEAE